MRSTDPDKQLDKLLVEQSSELLEATKHRDEDARRTLASWLLQSKRHVRTHLFMAALEEELKQIDPHRRIPVPDIRVDKAPRLTSLPLPQRTTASLGRRWGWAFAAVALMMLGATLVLTLTTDAVGRWQEFTTAIGEQRAVSLADGSIVRLNTGSRIKVRLSEASREIRLLDGEALFKVQQDRARPFKVHTSDALIVAVGTQFNVYRVAGKTRVSVLEGRVRVSAGKKPSPSLLTAGEEAEIRASGRIERRTSPDVADTTAWIQRRVVFKQKPLAEIVVEFNRYRKLPQFRVENAALAARRYSGIFDVDDPKSLEDVLSSERDVALDHSVDGRITIRGIDR